MESVRTLRWGGDEAVRWIELEKPWPRGVVTQRITLYRDEPSLIVETRAGRAAAEDRLSIACDFVVAPDSITFEIPYGTIAVPAMSGDRPVFSRGNRWSDVSGAEFGVSVITDARGEWELRGGRLRFTTSAPGTYVVYPHPGDRREGRTARRAVELDQPLRARVEPEHPGLLGRSWSFVGSDADNVHVTALKRAEDGRAYVVRVVEAAGRPTRATLGFGRRLLRVRTASLLEHPLATLELAGDRRSVAITLRPFEIQTLLVELAR
jgi:alpha-mannosidase